MAQDKPKPNIPEQISWTKKDGNKIYRGNNEQLQFAGARSGDPIGMQFAPKQFGKNSNATNQTFNTNGIDLGGAIEINFTGNNGNKLSYPTIQPINSNQQKPQHPIIQVISSPINNNNNNNNNNNDDQVPVYDGFQPHYAHYSQSMDPIKMKQSVLNILQLLVDDGGIDFYETSPYVYRGRTYSSRDDAQFTLSIFSDDNYESVVELRRSGGECFTYSNIESILLSKLKNEGAFNNNQDNKNNDDDINDDDDDDTSSFGFGSFGFGFDALPSLDNMDIDTTDNDDYDDDDDDDDNKTNIKLASNINQQKMTNDIASNILMDAVNKDSMRDVWRSDIAYLNESMSKYEDIFKSINNIISTLINAMTDDIFDCWAIKTYLGMISKLISCQATIPSNLSQSINHIKTRWSQIVINKVAPGVQFEFYPSQQIVRCCNQILDQLK